MIRIAKSLLGKEKCDDGFEHLVNIKEQVKDGLSPQENSVINYLMDSYKVHNKFPTCELFLNKFPEYIQAYNDEENSNLDDDSLAYYVYEYIHNKRKQIASRKMMEMSSIIAISPQGLTQDMVETLREFVVTNDDPIDETKSNVIDLYEESKKRTVNGTLKTYVPEIDDLTGGIETGTVTVISGFAGCGKSTWAVNIAYKNAKNGHSVVYISLEMTQTDLLFNLISLHSLDPKFKGKAIPSSIIRRHQMNDEQEKYFKFVADDYNKTVAPNLRILTEVSFHDFSQGEVREVLYRLDDIKPIEAVFVDQANLLKFYGKSKFSNVGDAINEYVSFFRRMSISFRKNADSVRQIATFMLCQCNRQGYLKAQNQKDQNMKGKYDMTAIAEANELERAASLILMIYSDDDLKLIEEARVQLLKSRFGKCQGVPIPVCFKADFSQIGEMSDMSSGNTGYNSSDVFNQIVNVDASALGFDTASLNLDLGNI